MTYIIYYNFKTFGTPPSKGEAAIIVNGSDALIDKLAELKGNESINRESIKVFTL